MTRCRALVLAAVLSVCVGPVAAETAGPVAVRVDAGQTLRVLPDRAMFGHNLSFVSSANGMWDANRGRFRPTLWSRLEAINPGLLRYPGGNWSYGFHFNLAREGIPHWVNTDIVTPRFRPQDFLRTMHDLPGARALVHLSPIWSSPEEAAAFVAYLIGDPDDRRRIGPDSWDRVDPATGLVLDWRTVGHWAALREADGQPAYRETLYVQLGNEEWFGWCSDRVCDGRVDHYGLRRPRNKMTVVETSHIDPVSGVIVPAYWPAYRAGYLAIRGLFTAERVKIGALAYARPDGRGGADTFFRRHGGGGDRWNRTLLGRLNADPDVTADFLTLHAYMYDHKGWERDFPAEGAVNALFASSHLAARVEEIFRFADSPRYPVLVTEFNVHIHGSIASSSLLAALSYVDFTIGALHDDDIIGMARWELAQRRSQQGFRGGGLFATNSTRGERNDFWKTGPYYAALMFGRLHRRIVASTVENAPTFRPLGLDGRWVSAGQTESWWAPSELPLVSGVATLSDDGDELSLLMLNRSTTSPQDVQIALAGFTPASAFQASVLNAARPAGHGDLFVINPWRISAGERCTPDAGGCTSTLASEAGENVVLTTTTRDGAAERFAVTLPAHSAALLTFARQP